jgi:hypothetical protein
MFTEADLVQIKQKGLTEENVVKQIETFRKGFPWLNVIKAAVLKDGILSFNPQELDKLVALFDEDKVGEKIEKFVPASGAATRMFKSLFEHLDKSPRAALPPDIEQVIQHIESFAFHPELEELAAQNNTSPAALRHSGNFQDIIRLIVGEEGLNYGNLPKGLLKFHAYGNVSRTPTEEHMAEGAIYALNADDKVYLHFTVSPEHLEGFKKLVKQVQTSYEKHFNVVFDISFSIQKPSTDTIAVGADNNPFRNADGSLLFRPGGHGALLENLQDMDGDIIFIKNIDNVVPDQLKSETIKWKMALAGYLMILQKQIFNYIKKLQLADQHDETLYSEITVFIESKLGYKFAENTSEYSEEEFKTALFDILNRPLRVCGMVKNTGEPGGGPFWVRHSDGSESLQILESSQIQMSDPNQKQIFKTATHFNPVDLVVGIRDYNGHKFNLSQFRDPETGFISEKSKDGQPLRALELPGLWNGSMAFWNTAFVEVPEITFNPVKTINDLLRLEHQNLE